MYKNPDDNLPPCIPPCILFFTLCLCHSLCVCLSLHLVAVQCLLQIKVEGLCVMQSPLPAATTQVCAALTQHLPVLSCKVLSAVLTLNPNPQRIQVVKLSHFLTIIATVVVCYSFLLLRRHILTDVWSCVWISVQPVNHWFPALPTHPKHTYAKPIHIHHTP